MERNYCGMGMALIAAMAVGSMGLPITVVADSAPALSTTAPGVEPNPGASLEPTPRGGDCDVNAGGCTPAGNTMQVGITGAITHACGGPNDEWTSLAYPIYGTVAGQTVNSINITHNTNAGIGSLYLMTGTDTCPNIKGVFWTGDSVIQGNGTGSETRYCVADSVGGPVLIPETGTTWVVAAYHSSFAFDVAFDCVDPGAPGQAFGNLGGDATDCGTWVDLNSFPHGAGAPCSPGGTFGGCPLVSLEIEELGTCLDCPDPILDSCGTLPCADITSFQARCVDGGPDPDDNVVQARIIVTGAHDGTQVTFEVDGVPVNTIISGGIASIQVGANADGSTHNIFQADPECCGERQVFTSVTCPSP